MDYLDLPTDKKCPYPRLLDLPEVVRRIHETLYHQCQTMNPESFRSHRVLKGLPVIKTFYDKVIKADRPFIGTLT